MAFTARNMLKNRLAFLGAIIALIFAILIIFLMRSYSSYMQDNLGDFETILLASIAFLIGLTVLLLNYLQKDRYRYNEDLRYKADLLRKYDRLPIKR